MQSLLRKSARIAELESELTASRMRLVSSSQEMHYALEAAAYRERVSRLCSMISLSCDDSHTQMKLLRELVVLVVDAQAGTDQHHKLNVSNVA